MENLAEQRALETVGFRQDGVVRGRSGVWRGGAYHDIVLYSVLRDDCPTGR